MVVASRNGIIVVAVSLCPGEMEGIVVAVACTLNESRRTKKKKR